MEPTFTCVPATACEAEWAAFVAAHPWASASHGRALAALETRLGATDHSFAVRDAAGAVVAVCPLFAHRQARLAGLSLPVLTGGSLLPSGPLFAPALAPDRLPRPLVTAMLEAVEARAAAADAALVECWYALTLGDAPGTRRLPLWPLRAHGIADLVRPGLAVPLGAGEAALFARLASPCQRQVKRAGRDGLRVEPLTDRARFVASEPVRHALLGDDAEAPGFLAAVWDTMVAAGACEAWTVTGGGRDEFITVATVVGATHYYWLGHGPADRRPGAANLAIWHLLARAEAAGARWLELGTIDEWPPRMAGITRFKRTFGPEALYAIGARRVRRPVPVALIGVLEALAQWRRARRAAGPPVPDGDGA
ncbi:MAG: GNAT family N-acetyltransferase [Gemmatimonadales bacterium]|nr:GNAT family N-acetyltransferase [Gemmatimonadales bacterium]